MSHVRTALNKQIEGRETVQSFNRQLHLGQPDVDRNVEIVIKKTNRKTEHRWRLSEWVRALCKGGPKMSRQTLGWKRALTDQVDRRQR